MKHFKLILFPFTLCLLFVTTNSSLAEKAEDDFISDQEFLNAISNHLDDDDSLIELPNGGYLHGKATLISNDDPEDIIAELDSDNPQDREQSITFKDYKQTLNLEENTFTDFLEPKTLTRGTSPANQTWSLNYGSSYYSNKFNGTGWQYAGYYFVASNSPEPYLRWECFNTGTGTVGTKSEANETYRTGVAKGPHLAKGENNGKYLKNTRTFYCWNPSSSQNVRYWVGNVD